MKVLTVKSTQILDEELQLELHHSLGMEHYTDYVFKPRSDQRYSATIVLENSGLVIDQIRVKSASFPDQEIVIDDLDMEKNSIDRYRLKNGEILEQLSSGWKWDAEDQ